jgi:osmoprotectant transport system permease protein
MQRFYTTPLIVGATLSVALAILADGLLVLTQRWVTPWARPRGKPA